MQSAETNQAPVSREEEVILKRIKETRASLLIKKALTNQAKHSFTSSAWSLDPNGLNKTKELKRVYELTCNDEKSTQQELNYLLDQLDKERKKQKRIASLKEETEKLKRKIADLLKRKEKKLEIIKNKKATVLFLENNKTEDKEKLKDIEKKLSVKRRAIQDSIKAIDRIKRAIKRNENAIDNIEKTLCCFRTIFSICPRCENHNFLKLETNTFMSCDNCDTEYELEDTIVGGIYGE